MLTLCQTFFQMLRIPAVSKTVSLGSGRWEDRNKQQVTRQVNKMLPIAKSAMQEARGM